MCNIQVLLWNFNNKGGVPGKQETKTKLSMNHGQCCQTSWPEHESRAVSVCAQNVSGMVSEPSPGLKEPVIGVHEVSCPAPPHSHSSAKTRRLHLQPFHSLPFSPAAQDIGSRGGAELSSGALAGRSNRGQRLEIDGRREKREEKSLAGNCWVHP